MRGLEFYNPAAAPFRSWLFGIANNVLREAARSLARLPVGHARIEPDYLDLIPARTTAITTRLARDEALQMFLERLKDWPEAERRLLIYRGLEGLSFREISELLGEAEATVAKRWQRLRERMQGLCERSTPLTLFDA